MDLSPEQMNIVTGSEVSAWSPVDLPTGRQEIPAWCLGAHINWRNGYGNTPDVTLKVRGAATDSQAPGLSRQLN